MISTSITSCKKIKKIRRHHRAQKIAEKSDLDDYDTKTALWVTGGFVVIGGIIVAIAANKNKKNKQ